MPRQPAYESRTEHVVLKLDALYSGTENTAKRQELRRYQWYIQLYELLLGILNTKERWFIEQHYNRQSTLAAITALEDGPFYGYDRTTVWKFKKRLLAKADAVLNEI